jgi:hypothetical protein
MEDAGILYGHLVHFTVFLLYFMDIWYILWSFWYIFLVLVFCAEKNLALCCTVTNAFTRHLSFSEGGF